MALFHFSSRGTGRAAEPDTMSLGSTTTGAYLVLMGVAHKHTSIFKSNIHDQSELGLKLAF